MIKHATITLLLELVADRINRHYDGYRSYVDVSGDIPQLVVKEETVK